MHTVRRSPNGMVLRMKTPPPLHLPGEHFIAAMIFFICGAVSLWYVAPMLASGAYPAASVVTLTHLFTLGWLTTSIMGALYQFLPVALGRAIESERLAHLTFGLHVIGVTCFVAGISLHHSTLSYAGVGFLGAGLTGFLGNLVITLRRAPQRALTWWALSGAAFSLAIAVFFGVLLGIHRFTGFLGAAHDLALLVHLHAGLFGWVMLVIVGVSHRLLPMFLLSHGADERFGWWAAGLLSTGTVLLSLFHHVPVIGRELPLLLYMCGLLAWAVQVRIFFRRRHRPELDAGLRLSAIGSVLIAITPLPLLGMLWSGAPITYRVLYAGFAILGSALFVAAHYYKIVPFLIWNRYFGPLAGTRPLPRVADLYAAREANIAIRLLAVGVILVLAGVALPSTDSVRITTVRVGAVLASAGALLQAWQLWGASRRRP